METGLVGSITVETASLSESAIKNNRKIAMAQIHSIPGALAANTQAAIQAISDAREQGAGIVVLPELMLPGYCAMDLFYNRAFLKLNRDALQQVCAASKGMTVICGFVDEDPTQMAPGGKPWIYNAAAVIHDGKLISVQHKELLPTYDVFDEKRYFRPAESRSVVKIGDMTLGVAICEDLWAHDNHRDIVNDLVDKGADVVLSLNASPFSVGKLERRLGVLEGAAKEHGVPIVYTNLVGAQDGYDSEVVFDGSSIAVDADGDPIAMSPSFTEGLSIVDLDRSIKLSSDAVLVNDIGSIHDALVMGIREFFSRKNMTTAYIGLSGGIDSAVVAALLVEALGADHVIGITMPSHITSAETKSDAFLLAEKLDIPCFERPIIDEYNAWLEGERRMTGVEPSSLRKQNKQSRLRTATLYDYTYQTPGSCHINTGNKTEIALGYFTLGGDSTGALAPLGDVDKLRVYELAKFCNRLYGQEIIPETTITRPPTAELEVGQTDANSLPADYDTLVPLVNAIVESDISYEALIEQFGAAVVNPTMRLIRLSEGKRRQLPPAIRITDKAFGIERRIPMDYPLTELPV